MAFTSVIKMIKMGSDKSNHIFYMAIFADIEIKYRYSDNSKSHHLQQMSYVQHQLSSWLIWMRTEFMHVFFNYTPSAGLKSPPLMAFTETEMLSFWWNFHHWLHWKLSKWQLPVQPVMKISSKWRHFRFSV